MTEIVSSNLLDRGKSVVLIAPGGVWKRLFDVVAATSALILLSPLFLFVAALVKYDDGGRIFFGHRRIGQGGNEFRCLKFRTMVPNSEEVLSSYLRRNRAARIEWQATRKLKRDPRVTPLGRVLRKLSVDELPQLINIIKGDMSLVGPRPVIDDELEYYGPDLHCYLAVRPGLTGLWQISGRNDVSYEDRVAYDRQYYEGWSFIRDLRIIVLTVPAILSSRGSY
ncbi:sugar transferase [Mesorhizobium denitrificans]|uniref:Sugar transferase n=1 Tax=Mesorhizobium denitrificans TaxID=2294114 RepID=A0A371X990_9HYPH|nr:sugar transferase [Mesorhizobium denitrificans]